VREVSDGYGRNFLIPRGLVMLAKSGAIKTAEVKLAARDRAQAQTEAELGEIAAHLDGVEVILTARAGTKDRLYGSITAADIAAGLESSTGLVIDKRKIELDESIRQVGSYEVPIRLSKDIVPRIKVTVSDQAA
jgi:large subunit ribosomal protein L9